MSTNHGTLPIKTEINFFFYFLVLKPFFLFKVDINIKTGLNVEICFTIGAFMSRSIENKFNCFASKERPVDRDTYQNLKSLGFT